MQIQTDNFQNNTVATGITLASWVDGKQVSTAVAFVLQGNNGSWTTIPAGEYHLDRQNGRVIKKIRDSSGTAVNWSAYTAYRATYALYDPTTYGTATYPTETQTYDVLDFVPAPFDPATGMVNATALLGLVVSAQQFADTIQSDNFSSGSAGWQITRAGNAEFNNVTVRGTIYAAAGAIGGFDIGTDYLRDAANSFGLASTVTGANDVRFWAGSTFASRTSAPLQIYEDGFIFAKDIVLAKGSLSGASGATGYGYAVDPLLLCHYDGALPFASDFKGSAIGHKGQVDTRTGGVIFRQGMFNKAVQVAEATTNLVLNPSAETTGNFVARGTATVTRDTATYLLGATSYKVVLAAANDGIDLTTSALANAVHYITFWVTGSAIATLQVSMDGSNWNAITQLTTQVSNGVTWTLCGVSILAAQANGSTTTRLRNTASSGTFYIDAVQVEQKSYSTPYCDGTLGDGHSWSGTAHASTSSRTAAQLTYPASGNINLAQGTVSFWYFERGVYQGFPTALGVHIDANNHFAFHMQGWGSAITPYVSTVSGGVAANAVSNSVLTGGWHHYAVTWTNGGSVKIYIDGVVGSTTGSHVTPVGTPTTIEVGSRNNANVMNTWLDDLAILPVVLTDHEIKSIYYSTAPLMLGVSNQEFRLSGPGLGETFGNANGLFGRAADGSASFGILNGTVNATVWGGSTAQSETFDSGDFMFGSNASGKANLAYDASAGQLKFRGGIVTNLYISSAGILTFVADAGSYAKWVTGSATLGEMWAGASGGFGTLVIIGRGKDATDTTGVVKLQANKHNDASTSNLAVASYGSATLTGVDGVASQLSTLYTRDFGGGTTVQGTTTETTIYSATINGNAMSSQGILTVELGGDLKNNSGLTPNLTLRVKFGGTTVCTLKVSNITSFSGVGGYVLRARIANDGNTNAQRAFASLIASKNGTWDGTSADYGTAAIDTTSNATLLVTAQWSTAAGSPEAPGVFSKGGLVEIQRTN